LPAHFENENRFLNLNKFNIKYVSFCF